MYLKKYNKHTFSKRNKRRLVFNTTPLKKYKTIKLNSRRINNKGRFSFKTSGRATKYFQLIKTPARLIPESGIIYKLFATSRNGKVYAEVKTQNHQTIIIPAVTTMVRPNSLIVTPRPITLFQPIKDITNTKFISNIFSPTTNTFTVGSAPGVGLKIISARGKFILLELPSGKKIWVDYNCLALPGKNLNKYWHKRYYSTAGSQRYIGIKPRVKNKIKNPRSRKTHLKKLKRSKLPWLK